MDMDISSSLNLPILSPEVLRTKISTASSSSSTVGQTPKPYTLNNLWQVVRGRLPGQVVVQLTDRCNARCPQCEMRVQNKFERSTQSVETVKRIIDAAAEQGVEALSLTGGEPFLYQEEILELIRHAGNKGIPYVRTGTNGFLFLGSHKANWEHRVHALASSLAETNIYTFWISVDSLSVDVHEEMRGLPGVIAGIEKALPIFHEYGIYPSANLGLNRNAGGKYQTVFGDLEKSESFDSQAFQEKWKEVFSAFYEHVINLGFSIVNMCYPMSIDPNATNGQSAAYRATSTDEIVRFRTEEKVAMFQALLETIPEYRSKIRIFTPITSLLALVRQYSGEVNSSYGCRGGIDFFYVNAEDGNTYPCGFRGEENLGKFWELNRSELPTQSTCTKCDWECFRDPSEMLGPTLDLFTQPWSFFSRWLKDPEHFRLWREDLRYYKACDYFSGRIPKNELELGKFIPTKSTGSPDSTD